MGDLSRNFSRHEFACPCGCGQDTVDAQLLAGLQVLRDILKVPVSVSGNRCPERNSKIQGASSSSSHLNGRAADVSCSEPPEEVFRIARLIPQFTGIGIYDTHVHVDTRTGQRREWDKREAVR